MCALLYSSSHTGALLSHNNIYTILRAYQLCFSVHFLLCIVIYICNKNQHNEHFFINNLI
jgi:hypothetical protein